MAKQYTGIDGSLYVGSTKVARVADWSFSAEVEALEVTSLGDHARDYINGIQSYSGSATLYYYENASNAIEGAAMLGKVLTTAATPTDPDTVLELRLGGGSKDRSVKFKCLIASIEISASTGEIIQASINFNVCGPLQAVSMV